MYIEPIKKVTLSDEIAKRILQQVRLGYFKSGERLPSERELCETFDASRTTIREAIKGLASMGVIQKKRDGNHVCDNLSNIIAKPFSILLSTMELSITEITEARLTIECQLARLAALRATEEELEQMEACLIEDNSTNENILMQYSIRFHKLIAASTRNKVLEEMYSVIYRILLDKRQNEDSLRRIHKSQLQHREILEAIRSHNPDRAEQSMRIHLASLVK